MTIREAEIAKFEDQDYLETLAENLIAEFEDELPANDEHERDFDPKLALIELAARTMWAAVCENDDFDGTRTAILARISQMKHKSVGGRRAIQL
jgi:hypothetical protein